jgi:RecA-family ATPase
MTEIRALGPLPGNIMTFKQMADLNIPIVNYKVKGLIPDEGISILFGPPKSGKSNLAIYLCECLGAGKKFFEYETKKCKCLYIDEENRERGMKTKIIKIIKGGDFGEDTKNMVISCSSFSLAKPESRKWLDERIEELKPGFIVIDSVAKVFPLDERNEQEVKNIFRWLNPLVVKYGVSFLLIHHSRKSAKEQHKRDSEDLSGSREFAGMVDSLILLEKHKGFFLLKQTENRYDAEQPAINFTLTGDDEKLIFTYKGLATDNIKEKKVDNITAELIKWHVTERITKFETKDALKAMKILGYKDKNIRNALTVLLEKEAIKKLKFGVYEWEV